MPVKTVIDVQWLGNKRIITFEDGSFEEKVFEGEGYGRGIEYDKGIVVGGSGNVQLDRHSESQVKATKGK